MIADYQQKRLHELLRHVWQKSSFYRGYYRSHGIRERDLAEVTIEDLPFLTKQMLMENFDGAVTDSRIRKRDLETWIQEKQDRRDIFFKGFIVYNTSGSSGRIGLFVYDEISWKVMAATMAHRLPQPENHSYGKTRVASYMPISTLQMPKSLYDVSVVFLLDPIEKVVRQLNAFQPHRVIGYSSTVATLADQALLGKLRISPRTICVSGDKLTEAMERKMLTAWRAPVHVLYCCSESVYVAVKKPGEEEMTVVDDLNILEILGNDDQPAPPGGVGRVVLTNLYNYALPVLRYELGDYARRGLARDDSPFTTLRDIQGRVSDALPVTLDSGERDTIHPIELGEFYAAGLEKVQFVSLRPDRIRIDYVAEHDIGDVICRQFERFLKEKGASRSGFEVRRVNDIPPDRRSGKLRLVRMETGNAHTESGSVKIWG